jgi:hypothetical protein
MNKQARFTRDSTSDWDVGKIVMVFKSAFDEIATKKVPKKWFFYQKPFRFYNKYMVMV